MQAPSPTGHTSTDIEAAMHTLSLHQPDDQWYMDTGATSHMTTNPGTLTSYSTLSKNTGIVVSNGSIIPIRGSGHTSLSPLTLRCISITFYMHPNSSKTLFPFVDLPMIIMFLLNLILLGFLLRTYERGVV